MSDDLIMRSRALNALKLEYKDVVYVDKNEVAKKIKAIPSSGIIPPAEPSRPKGEWMATEDFDEWYGLVYKCNICGNETIGGCDNYCPNCGAKMGTDCTEVEQTEPQQCDDCVWSVCNYNKVDWDRAEQTETQTETQNSNKNSNVISVYDGVSEAVRCAMCNNPNKSDRGCDGACSYNEKLYERIMQAIAKSVADTPQTDCGDFADRLAYERGVKHAWEVAQKVFDSTVTFYEAEDVAKQIDKDINVHSKYEPQTDCSWK